MSNEQQPIDNSVLEYEPDQLSMRWITAASIGLLVLILFVIAGLFAFFAEFPAGRDIPSAEQEWRRPRAGAGVQPNQAYDRVQIEAQQQRWLEEYGWQNEEHTFARIPIDRAVEMMAERKLMTAWPNLELTKENSTDITAENSTHE